MLRLRRGKKKILSNVEELIMGVLWEAEKKLTLQEIQIKISDTYKVDISSQELEAAPCTLEDKAFVAVINKNECNYYVPIVEKEIYVRTVYKGLACRFYHGDEEEMAHDIRKEDSILPDNEDFIEVRRDAARYAIANPDKSDMEALKDMFG